MNNKKNYKKGPRKDIIKLLLICGSLPYDSLRLLNGSHVLIMRTARRLKNEGLACIEVKQNIKQIYLRHFAWKKKEYINEMPEGYETYVNSITKKEKKNMTTDEMKAKRLLKESEVIVMMYASKINCLPDEKINIVNPKNEIGMDDCCYYLSREVKDAMGYKDDVIETEGGTESGSEGSKKIINARSMGCIVSPGGIYSIYNIGNRLIEWKRAGELKMKICVEQMINKKHAKYLQYKEFRMDSAIILYNQEKVIKQIVELEYKNREKEKMTLINIDYAYQKMYAVPMNENGKTLLRMMTLAGWKNAIKSFYLEEEDMERAKLSHVGCDAFDGNKYTLLFCIPNMAKLKHFIQRASMEECKDKFEIYCFAFQKELIISLAGNIAHILIADLKECFEELVKEGCPYEV